MFDTVLVANRGEIAVRVIATLRDLGIRSVAVHSDADARARHVREADTALRLGPTPAAESYLHVGRILDAAAATGAQAIHPGYGFLSENAAFARACADAGLVFVGPPPEAIEAMGDKIRAKLMVEAAGVPVVPGVHRPGMSDAELIAAAATVGFPLLVKAAAGGGGRGMRVVREPGALAEALAAARREARGAFGDDALLLERYVERPRHIEIQVLADAHGNVVHLGERECSLQRRHQKVVEEAPSPVLVAEQRRRMGAAAVDVARACGYVGAGTVEFILSGQDLGPFFFLEMNTRLQVEHPVTEEVTGLDLVEQQLRVAAGERLGFTQDDVGLDGHAVEARVYAEDPARGFVPTGGTILDYQIPSGAGVRVDCGVEAGNVVGSAYDPMLAKVVAHGPDRPTALRRLEGALAEFVSLGVVTNVAFLRALLADPDVQAGRLDTGLIARRVDDLVEIDAPEDVLAAAGLARLLQLEPDGGIVDPFDLPGGWRLGDPAWTSWRLRPGGGGDRVDVRVRGRAWQAEVAVGQSVPRAARAEWDGGDLVVTIAGRTSRWRYAEQGEVAWLGQRGAAWSFRALERLEAQRPAQVAGGGPLLAPMPGTVCVVHVAEGDAVRAGQTLVVVEAMKLEHPITAPVDGTVARLHVRRGQQVGMDEPLVVVEAPALEAAVVEAAVAEAAGTGEARR